MHTRHRCPFCLERTGSEASIKHLYSSLSFNIETGQYNCFRCHAHNGNTYLSKSIARKLGVDFSLISKPRKRIEKGEIGYEPISPVRKALKSHLLKSQTQWLLDRGIQSATIQDFGLGVCNRGPRWLIGSIVFPLHDPLHDDELYVYRRKSGEYASPGVPGNALFNARVMRKNARVYVVEGASDVVAVYPVLCVATLGKDITDVRMERLAGYGGDLVIALDGDAWEQAQVICARLRFRGKQNVGWIRLEPGVDPGDVGRRIESYTIQ